MEIVTRIYLFVAVLVMTLTSLWVAVPFWVTLLSGDDEMTFYFTQFYGKVEQVWDVAIFTVSVMLGVVALILLVVRRYWES